MNRWLMFALVGSLAGCSSDPSSSEDGPTEPTGSPSSTSVSPSSSNSSGGASSTTGPNTGTSTAPSNGTSTDGSPSSSSSTRPSTSSGETLTTTAPSSGGSSTSEQTSDVPSTSEAPSEGPVTSDSPTSTGETPTSEACNDGPLSEPLPNCAPEFEETGDYYADCVARINQFRWECQCLPPLERREQGEDCADQHSQYDFEMNAAHAGFRANICEPGGSAQNECPGYGGRFGIVDFCLQQMWDEGPGEDFQAHGHYINMSSQEFSGVACGTYTTPDGEIWAVQNFFR